MSEIILYSTNCPNCKILLEKLKKSQVNFEVCSNIDIMRRLGIKSVPVLSVNGELLTFIDSIKWVEERLNSQTLTI